MKTIVATLSTLMVGISLLSAGPSKEVIIPDVCDCYPPGLQIGGNVAGLFLSLIHI